MSIETYEARAIIDIVSWIHRDPERAFDMGMKLIGIGVVFIILAALMSE